MVQLACQAEGEGIVQKLGPEHGAIQLANENKRIARVQNWPDIIFGLCVLTFLCPCLLIFLLAFLSSFCLKMEHQTMLSVTHTCQLRSALCLLSEVGRSALTTPEFWLVSFQDDNCRRKFSHLWRVLDPIVAPSPQVRFYPFQVLGQLNMAIAVEKKNYQLRHSCRFFVFVCVVQTKSKVVV